MAQLDLAMPKKFCYFGIYTPVALTSQCLLEMSGKEYEGVSVTFEQWGELKPKTPTGCLPYADMPDGSVIAESGAIGRCIAGASGRLGSGKDFIMSEQLAGMTADLNKKAMGLAPTVMTLDGFDAAKKAAYEEGKGDVIAFVDKYKPFLLASGDRFTESGETFGEVDLFCKMYCHVQGAYPGLATGPLAAFYKRMSEIAGVKKVLAGESKFGALGQYLVPVA